MKAVGMSGSRNVSRIAGALPFIVWGRKCSGFCLQGLILGWRQLLCQHIPSSSSAARDFQGVSQPGCVPLTPGESILRRAHQTQPTENLALIRRQLYSGHKSISSGKRGETRISRLPNREWLRNSAIYKKYASCTEGDKPCL